MKVTLIVVKKDNTISRSVFNQPYDAKFHAERKFRMDDVKSVKVVSPLFEKEYVWLNKTK